MRRILSLLLALVFAAGILNGPVAGAQAAAKPGITVLCYHHVGPFYTTGRDANTFTVTPQVLRAHFEYLRQIVRCDVDHKQIRALLGL